MKTGEYIEYLQQFDKDSELSFIVGNPSNDVRKIYPIKDVLLISDSKIKIPCTLIEVGNPLNMDEEDKNLDSQMSIEDYPEVQP